ncbi:MAG: N-acetylmuramoyl-L-alanine amidase [Sphingobacteriaceae bacterium]|nr:N-acetylmuramoyl-L-alanine amidase [Sphingobacteriaceae bacterium]
MKNIPSTVEKIVFSVFIYISLYISNDNQCFAQKYEVKTIVIDAGHGGKDGSTHGLISKEKDVALRTALNLGRAIEENLKDVKVIYTRTTDVFVPLYERINIANHAKADLFISIHLNDMPKRAVRVQTGTKKKGRKRVPVYSTTYQKSTSTRGVETFVSGTSRISEQDEVIKRENASMFLEDNYKSNYAEFDPDNLEANIVLSMMKYTFRDKSLNFAQMLQDEYVKVGRVNRGVQEKSLAVLARASMPAVLTEIGFLSNDEEERYMNSDEGQNEIVMCILRAIESYKQSVEIK